VHVSLLVSDMLFISPYHTWHQVGVVGTP
jgi:hypothetical protein